MAIYSNRIVVSVSKIKAMLNITNSQSTPTQAGLQVMWQVPVSTLQTSLIGLYNLTGVNSNLSNLRFVYNGQFVPAWLESINNGTATIWIKMPVSIPANSSITLNLYANSNLNFDGVYWGEAPQLSPTYAQYDNGASMFNFYDNFAGTSLNTNKWINNVANIGGTLIINNGLSYIRGSGGNTGLFLNSVSNFFAGVFETYGNIPAGGTSGAYTYATFGLMNSSALISVGDMMSVYGLATANSQGGNGVGGLSGGIYVWQVWVPSSSP